MRCRTFAAILVYGFATIAFLSSGAARGESVAPSSEIQVLDFESLTESKADEGGLCTLTPEPKNATCVPADGCGTFSCRVDSDCDAFCCGPNFGRCVTSCGTKPNTKACICLA